MYFHNVEQRSAQIRRAMLGGSIAARAVIARFTRRRVNACKGNQRLFALKAAHITDLRHELRSKRFTNTVHFHDDRIFRKLRYQLVHLAAIRFSTARDCCELVCSFLNERFRDRCFLHQYNGGLCQSVYLGSFLRAELVTVSLAPLAVTLGKSVQTAAANAIGMPEIMSEIHPLLGAVTAYRTVKQLADTGKRLFLKCDEVVCGSGFLLNGQLKLTVHSFQIIADCIHRSIITQFAPIVKSIFGNLHGIRLVCLDLAERIIAVLLDKQRIDCRNVKSGFMENLGDALIVTSGVLHNYSCFALNGFKLFGQRGQLLDAVAHIEWQFYHLAKRTKYGHGTLAAGNVNACCVHVYHS